MTDLMIFSGFIITWVIQLGLTIAIVEKIEDKRRWEGGKNE